MKTDKNLIRILLLTCFHFTGVWSKKEAVFLYSRVGGEALLPCSLTNQVSPDCSSISWTFFYKGGGVRYTEEVTNGKVRPDSEKTISILSNCSLILHDLRPGDAGSYICLHDGKDTSNVYLSLLSITSSSYVTELRPGGKLELSCVLHTYFDAGSCRLNTSVFRLSWTSEHGADKRYELIHHNRCLITLRITNLQGGDSKRNWRCQVNNSQNIYLAFLDFKLSFLIEDQSPTPRSDRLPISHIILCVALPIMVMVVGLFTWRMDRKRAENTENYEFQ